MINARASFKLYQPLVMLAKNYKEFIPQGEFRNSIAMFYQFQMTKSSHQLVAVPDGVIDIVFNCDPAKPSAKVIGSVVTGKFLEFAANTEHFGVRFLPGQSGVFIEYPAHDFVDREISLVDIMRKGGELIEKIVSQPNFSERVHAFLNTQFSSTCRTREMPLWGQYVMQLINERRGLISIKEMALETGYSPQYIDRTFNHHLGVCPKYFCRIVRFQNVLELIYSHSHKQMSDLVFELGYFDQAHFIKEFKDFCLCTPGQFVQENLKKYCNIN